MVKSAYSIFKANASSGVEEKITGTATSFKIDMKAVETSDGSIEFLLYSNLCSRYLLAQSLKLVEKYCLKYSSLAASGIPGLVHVTFAHAYDKFDPEYVNYMSNATSNRNQIQGLLTKNIPVSMNFIFCTL